jgi:ribose 5-phosphate isomerase B
MKISIAIGADHAAFELKTHLIQFLDKEGYTVIDVGCYSTDSVDYPDFAHALANKIEQKEAEFGVLLCGSGIGISIAANRHKHIRAALVWNETLAALARQHNNANVICLGARFTAATYAEILIKTFLNTTFEGGKHQKRIEKINYC